MFGTRYYDSSVGRWTQQDPAGTCAIGAYTWKDHGGCIGGNSWEAVRDFFRTHRFERTRCRLRMIKEFFGPGPKGFDTFRGCPGVRPPYPFDRPKGA